MSIMSIISSVGSFLSSNATSIVSAGATAYGAYTQYEAAQLAEDNANQEKVFQQQRTDLELRRFNDAADKRLATQRAILNKSGRSLKTGSAFDLLNEQQRQDELDAEIIRFGGDVNKARFESEAKKQKTLSLTRPTSTLLSGGARLI